MHRIQCAEICGGIRNLEQDVCSAGLVASLFSSACDGGNGGDIYYLSVCASDMLTRVAIADVMGHGQAVSDVIQYIYDALKSHMNDTSGDALLADANALAVKRGLKAMTTAAITGFYTSDNHLYFAYAGHHPILIKRKGDRNWFDANQPDGDRDAGHANLLLAVESDSVYTQQRMQLSVGDRVFLYTDGLIEAPDAEHHLFGADRLKVVLADHANAPLPELRAGVLKELRDHTGGDLIHDDVTLLALEIR